MASHDLHFAVSQNGVEVPNAHHDSATMPAQIGHQPPGSGSSTFGLNQSAHPIVCIFHVLFKGIAMFLYIFGNKFVKDSNGNISGANFVTVTVCCILLLAADFWTVKNITGRLLVGLRWWNKVEGETTKWIFESSQNRQVNQYDNGVFWTVLYVTPLIWGFLLFFGILRLNLGWLVIVVMALALSGANVYGYYKCSTDQKAKFQQMIQTSAQAGALTAIRSGLLGVLIGTPQYNGQQQQQQGGTQTNTFV